MNYYEVFGCNKNASAEELKRIYHEEVKKVHPDKSSEKGNDFLILHKAWKTLSDPSKRKEYDEELERNEFGNAPMYCEVDLNEMNLESDKKTFTYGCRCGGVYVLDVDNVKDAEEVREGGSEKENIIGKGSSARARRRARNINDEVKNNPPGGTAENVAEIGATRETVEIDSANKNNDNGEVKTGKFPATFENPGEVSVRTRREENRSEEDVLRNGTGKENLLKAQSNKMKGYLNSRDSFSKSLMKFNDMNALCRPSLEASVLIDNLSNTRQVESSYWYSRSESNSDIKVLASLLPDEILKDINAVGPKIFQGAILFADVSGFTELCEKFDKTGKGGPSRLTEILNDYVGAMIQIVLSKKGDIFKFGGDAILCLWKATADVSLKKSVGLSIESALEMQKNCRDKTDSVVQIRIKISIAAGEFMFSIVGESKRKYYVLVGEPVKETNRAEKLCHPGEIIVSPTAWKEVGNELLYNFCVHSNKVHVLVDDFGPLWNDFKSWENNYRVVDIRENMRQAENLKIEQLRPFILPCIMKCIDVNEPLEYLTEMRQVSIVFLKLNLDELVLSSEETITLCDKSYQIVTNLVERADGTVDKITYFDKDVCILIVFGLRGFKYEPASKMALKCAYNCLEKLRPISNASVSAGVTTGMAYCGVIGNFLRREYTVMGLPVNKAARLMCAYENIVSCDRETFLQSKLRSVFFEVREHKSLKGIHNIGPVYEFNLSLKYKKQSMRLSSYNQPLLNRFKEISIFEEYIKSYKTGSSDINFFVVYGGARIGKTKLISTFIRIVERYLSVDDNPSSDFEDDIRNFSTEERNSSNVEICFIPLLEEDYKTAYQTVRLIFQFALGLNESSTVEETEEKILMKLGDVKGNDFLAALNPILNVKFHFSNFYLNLSREEQFTAGRLMKKKLFKVCFQKSAKWLIVIDDAEFVDEASWVFLKWCCTISSRPLFIMAVGQQKLLSPLASDCLFSIPQKKFVLSELDKWFYTALACQILEVKAIPVELESLLQGYKNSGNPGWMESYLLSLLQTNSLQITYVTRQDMNNMKLVTAGEKSSYKANNWHESGSPRWLDWVESFTMSGSGKSEIIPVCVLGPNFASISKESELTMDMMYVKMMDRLKPLEQLILKAGSVLGYNFKRDALNFLIAKEVTIEEKVFAKSVKYLFEAKILCCDKGDFTYPSSLIMNKRSILTNNPEKDIKCSCKGLVRSEALRNMPDYAGCGLMRFRSTILKDTVYNLLLDEQKKKFHNLIIEFVRNNTYRCRACRSVLFDPVFGRKLNNELVLVCAETPMHGVRSTKVKLDRLFIKNLKYCLGEGQKISETLSTVLTDQNEEVYLSNNGVSNCECSQILCTVYSGLLEHADGAGRKDIKLEISLEYASVSLTSCNIPLTAQIIEETLILARSIEEENEYPKLCTSFIYGKIFTLMGATNLNMGRTDIASALLHTALMYLGEKIPKSFIGMQTRQVELEFKLITSYFSMRLIGGVVEDKKAAYLDLLSECLGLLCLVYIYAENWELAKFVSIWALNKALRSHRNFFGLCVSCANVMDVACHYNDKITSSKIENLAVCICEYGRNHLLEMYELEAIARLYMMIFRARHLRADIEDAISIGFKSLRIATMIRNWNLRLDLLPDLIIALVQMSRLSEAVSLLQELEIVSAQYCDKTGRVWYYAICIELQLDTGYTVLPYKACEKFMNEEEENLSGIRKSIYAGERLCTSMWLWCIRNGEWESSKRYFSLMKKQIRNVKMKTPSSVSIQLKKLEGFLITLAEHLNNGIHHGIMSITCEIKSIMKILEEDTKFVQLLRPRYLLMKAYYALIKNPRARIAKSIKKAFSMADRIKDKNTAEWIIHNKSVWRNGKSDAEKNFWKDHCKYDDFVDWHEAENKSATAALMFSLPLPNVK